MWWQSRRVDANVVRDASGGLCGEPNRCIETMATVRVDFWYSVRNTDSSGCETFLSLVAC